MTDDALAPYVARPSAAKVLTLYDKQFLLFKMHYLNVKECLKNTFLHFLETIQHKKG